MGDDERSTRGVEDETVWREVLCILACEVVERSAAWSDRVREEQLREVVERERGEGRTAKVRRDDLRPKGSIESVTLERRPSHSARALLVESCSHRTRGDRGINLSASQRALERTQIGIPAEPGSKRPRRESVVAQGPP